jgi:hypothetical protein
MFPAFAHWKIDSSFIIRISSLKLPSPSDDHQMPLIIGPTPSPFPSLHPNVAAAFASASTAPIHLFPVGLDVKQTECLRCLLADDIRARIVADWSPSAIPVFLSTDPGLESYFQSANPRLSVILDPHDKGRKLDFVGLPDSLWQLASRENLQIIYFKLQVHDPANYARLNLAPKNVHILSWPLLLGGSRFHITVQPDFQGDSLFSRTLAPNPHPDYQYDFSSIGAITSPDRQAAFDLLQKSPRKNAYVKISTPGHTDAAAATVPLQDYLQIARSTRINISLNGRGPWCLKDGELFANQCFILRQWHPAIDLNPLTPKDGIHWRIFRTENLLKTIEECLANPQGCQKIAAAGHANFREATCNALWSKCYAAALEEFQRTGQKSAWGNLAFA